VKKKLQPLVDDFDIPQDPPSKFNLNFELDAVDGNTHPQDDEEKESIKSIWTLTQYTVQMTAFFSAPL